MNPVGAADPVAAPRGQALTMRAPRLSLLRPGTVAAAVTAPESEGPDRVPRPPMPRRYRPLPNPSLLVYRVESDGHSQTGVVLEVAVQDYRAGRIRRHEATQPERVRRLGDALAAGGAEQVPVALAHHGREGLRALLFGATGTEPDLAMTADDAVRHTVWVQRDPATIRAILDELHAVDALYIADGHHRMAAADATGVPVGDRDPDCAPARAFTLAALFPAEQLRILGYHRCVRMPDGVSAGELLDAFRASPVVAGIERLEGPHAPGTEPGAVAVWLAGHWYRLWLLARPNAGARDRLDVVTLDEGLLKPVFGIENVQTHSAVTPLPGDIPADRVAGWCAERHGIGFLPHPPPVDTVLALADSGAVMPPKSTWFEPKLRLALFLRRLGALG